MKKIIAFAGSTSTKSINLKLVSYVAGLIPNVEVEILDLNDFELPLFSVDLEEQIDQPKNSERFLEKMKSADYIFASMAEHNGGYSAAFKNLLDWTSRIDVKVFSGKPMFLMATSPGARGGMGVLEITQKRFPFMGAEIKATFSLPEFNKNFDIHQGITSPDHLASLKQAIQSLNIS